MGIPIGFPTGIPVGKFVPIGIPIGIFPIEILPIGNHIWKYSWGFLKEFILQAKCIAVDDHESKGNYIFISGMQSYNQEILFLWTKLNYPVQDLNFLY